MKSAKEKEIADKWPKKCDKILHAEFDGNLYYPFDDKWVWFLPFDNDNVDTEWKMIPYPKEILFDPKNKTIIELILDLPCVCSNEDLFNFGCHC